MVRIITAIIHPYTVISLILNFLLSSGLIRDSMF